MACGAQHNPSPSPGSRLPTGPLAWAVVLLVFGLLLAPMAQAVDYEGPGQEGRVPVGAGPLLAENAPMAGEGVTHLPLVGVPAEVCRIVLDENGTYAGAQGIWSPGDETAYVAAEPGALEAPFKVAAHWERDLNDNCTVEVTPDQTFWHDPRGRPFIEPRFVDRYIQYDVDAGSWVKVEAEIHNNGTLPETINADLEHLRDRWELRNASSVVGVKVEPLQTVRFSFEVHIPADESGGTKLLLVNARGEKSDWSDRATFVLEVEEDVEARYNQDPKEEEEETGIDSHGSVDPPSKQDGPTGQVPVVAPGVLLVALVLLVSALRRRGSHGPQ